MIDRRNTPSPLYFRVTFLASEIKSGTRDFGSSVNSRASSDVIDFSLFNSFSLTVSKMLILLPPLMILFKKFYFTKPSLIVNKLK